MLAIGLGRRRRTDLWALRDVTLSCERGATLGVIGRNGSGKTTLLKLLAGVSAPTEGRLRVEGSIAPLIGVGVGFDTELTGRENALANGQLLGMSKRRIESELDEIVAFSELDEYLDVPVKFYSSGMFLRLGFAVAIQVRPEVLLVDEILAVGDIGFQAKCMARMAELRDNGTTVVVVTHNMPTLHQMCARTLVLSHGRVVFDGPTESAISAYHDLLHADGAARNEAGVAQTEGIGPVPFVGGARVRCEVVDDSGHPTRQAAAGDPIRIRVSAEFDRPVARPVVGIAVELQGVGALYMCHLRPGDYDGAHGPGVPLDFTVRVANPLLPGSFHVVGVVLDEDGRHELGRSASELFAVTSRVDARGLVDLDAHFTVGGREYAPRQLRLTQ
jgi:ABC-type polysaccharide/polyol phosphate transport system ATPase subunit